LAVAQSTVAMDRSTYGASWEVVTNKRYLLRR